METNIERIREKLIQEEFAKTLKKVENGYFSRKAKALAYKARRRERKQALRKKSPLKYAGYMALKAADKIICGLYWPFVELPYVMARLMTCWMLTVVLYCLWAIPAGNVYGTGAFGQVLQSSSFFGVWEIITFRGAVANSFFHVIIAVQTFFVYPAASSFEAECQRLLDFSDTQGWEVGAIILGIVWFAAWGIIGLVFGMSLFLEVCWLMIVWGSVTLAVCYFFNPLDLSHRYESFERSPARRRLAKFEEQWAAA